MSIIKSLQDYLETFEGMDMQPLTIKTDMADKAVSSYSCLLYTSPSPRDRG